MAASVRVVRPAVFESLSALFRCLFPWLVVLLEVCCYGWAIEFGSVAVRAPLSLRRSGFSLLEECS